MPDTALLVGSVELSTQTITVNGGGAIDIAAGSYYLRHSTPALSLFDAVQDAMGLGGASVTLRRNMRVRISALAGFDMTLSSRLQRLLGFDTALDTGATRYDAALVSPLLWAPGYPGTPASRAGKTGYKVPHTTRHKSDDGSRQETQFFGEEVWQELEWAFVPADLLMVPDDEDNGGALEGLYEETLKYGRPFHWHETISTDTEDDNAIIWTPSFGPYQLRDGLGNPNWYDRIRANTDDIGGGVGMKMHLVEELSNA